MPRFTVISKKKDFLSLSQTHLNETEDLKVCKNGMETKEHAFDKKAM